MLRGLVFWSHVLFTFYISLSATVNAADEEVLSGPQRRGYSKGEIVPVSCLNRTIETGEHITDDHGNLQYIPFMTCNETGHPLTFTYGEATSQNCTLDFISDELYHLLEYFVHSDVPLSCRVPSYPLADTDVFATTSLQPSDNTAKDHEKWTPFTIALQGTLQKSHLHLHTNINALFHTAADPEGIIQQGKQTRKSSGETSHLIGSTAYSLPGPTSPTSQALNLEGTKIVRLEPLVLTFNVGWIEGAVLPGMIGKPVMKLTDHNVGFSLLSFFAIAASAGVGAIGMLVYERRKSGRAGYGVLPVAGNGTARATGYGSYGGYGGYATSSIGKRD